MKIRNRTAAFSLLEVMIVVALLADLVVIALPSFLRARRSAQNTKFTSELRIFAAAFEMYAADNNKYPAETGAGVVPTGMTPYFRGPGWTTTNSIGGQWDWDYNQGYAKAAVCTQTPTNADPIQMVAIDAAIDNGVLATGSFREQTPNRRWAYIIE